MIVTTRTVNVSQLAHELGGAALRVVGPYPDDHEDLELAGKTKVTCDDITDATLEAAVAAHHADVDWVDPDYVAPPTRDQRIDEVVDTAPDWRTAVKALASEGLLAQ